MPSTPRGYPYPDGNAKLAETHLAIKALAETMQKTLQAGAGTVVTVAGGVASATVVFPVPFDTVPTAIACASTTNPALVNVSIGATTTTTVQVYMSRTSGSGAVPFRWFALA